MVVDVVVSGTLGERVAELRRRRGLSQKDLATEVGRSESWVSQVERDILPVERVSVLRLLADALGVSVRDLRPETAADGSTVTREVPNELAALRLAMTGHPALSTLLGMVEAHSRDVHELQADVDEAWRLSHASQYGALVSLLVPLLADLEESARVARGQQRTEVARLLTTAYQVAAATFARQGEADASWLAADRATRWTEDAEDSLGAVASGLRMGHAFITLRRLDQAEHVATQAITALAPLAAAPDCAPEVLSLYGAMHLLLAVVHAREGDRSGTRKAIDAARKIARRIGADRNDYHTEFGPTNVELHAVSTAVDLGDAGEAVDLANGIDASGLSPERQARLLIDLARAHVQRRHIGEAVSALLQAERLTPEQVQCHRHARQVVRDLLNLAGRRATPELLDLVRRIGA
ncbi:MAG: helix-turn-helix domain-containing protein [Pseudonocardiales bacterium]